MQVPGLPGMTSIPCVRFIRSVSPDSAIFTPLTAQAQSRLLVGMAIARAWRGVGVGQALRSVVPRAGEVREGLLTAVAA